MAKKLEMNTELVNAIYQYLSLAGMNDAAVALQKQCKAHKIELKPVNEQKLVRRDQIVAQKRKLLSHLEKDECRQFFKLWTELFGELSSCSGNSKSAEVISLEFYIRLYFATFPLRKSPPNKAEYQERIEELKKFLEDECGACYSANAQLVQYFALPYVAEPGKHPVFKELVQKKWAKSIVENLNTYLTKQATSINETQDALLQKWMTACQSQYNNILEKEYRELQDDYYRIVNIIDEMFEFLEQSTHGKEAFELSTEYVTEIKARLADAKADAEQHMRKSTAGNKTNEKHNRPVVKVTRAEAKKKEAAAAAAAIKKSESIGNLIPSDPNTRTSLKTNEEEEKEGSVAAEASIVMDNLIEQLNYTKIGNCLIKGAAGRLCCLLLQALRQRITRTSIKTARYVVEVYANNDLLLLKHLKNSVVSVIISQGDASGNDAKEELGRLLNSIASFTAGRNYLLANSQGKQLIASLTMALKARKLHERAGEHILATLQKLSIRSSVQKEFVQLGMVEWLSLYLGNKPSATALDYGCALLLNLCLNPSGKSAASRAATIFIATIMNLLTDYKLQVCNYINGVLYSVLGMARVKARAKEVNLASTVREKLECHHCKDDDKQLPIIYRILVGDLEAPLNWHLNLNDVLEAQETDYLEAEIESTDTVRAQPNELFGEQLLIAKFRLTDTLEKPASRTGAAVVDRDEITAPPGTVPRRSQTRRSGGTFRLTRNSASKTTTTISSNKNNNKSQQSPLRAANVFDVSSDDANRPDSVSSQQTFVLENSRRRPLIARDPFKIVLASTTQRKVKSLTKESETVSGKNSKELYVLTSSSTVNDNNCLSKNIKSPVEDGTNIEFLPDAPFSNEISTEDYSTVFKSKPKLPRTPIKCTSTLSPPDADG